MRKTMESLRFAVLLLAAQIITQAQATDCGQEELISCSKKLEVLSSTTSELSFVTKKEELDKICPDLHAGLNCIRSYTRRCMDMKQRDHFNKLYNGTNHMIHELCEQGKFQEDFLRHAPCMRHVKKEYDTCTTSYHSKLAEIVAAEESNSISTTISSIVNPNAEHFYAHSHEQGHDYSHEHSQEHGHGHGHKHHHANQHENATTTSPTPEMANIKTVCCAFQNYLLCSERTVRLTCGDETATFTKTFLDKMSSTMMRMHCENYSLEKCEERSVNSMCSTLKAQITHICIALSLLQFIVSFHF